MSEPDELCEECGHAVGRHTKDGCEAQVHFWRGEIPCDGDCGCHAITVKEEDTREVPNGEQERSGDV